MTPLTREQAIVISAYTGFLICDFADMQEGVEKKLGHPVWTHQFGNETFAKTVREAFRTDFVALRP